MTIYLDLETTGGGAQDEILEIAIVDDRQILMNQLIRPIRSKSWTITERVHGITPEMVLYAPTIEEKINEIVKIIRGQHVVIYNASFDTKFLPIYENALLVSCCMKEFAKFYREWSPRLKKFKYKSLGFAANYVEHIWSGNKHNALQDTLALRSVWKYLKLQNDQIFLTLP